MICSTIGSHAPAPAQPRLSHFANVAAIRWRDRVCSGDTRQCPHPVPRFLLDVTQHEWDNSISHADNLLKSRMFHDLVRVREEHRFRLPNGCKPAKTLFDRFNGRARSVLYGCVCHNLISFVARHALNPFALYPQNSTIMREGSTDLAILGSKRMHTSPQLPIDLPNLAATESFGCRSWLVLFPDAVVALIGPLGAGKTHLARAIAEGLVCR